MICTLTARRLKPDSYDQFRAAWDPTGTNQSTPAMDTRIPLPRRQRP